MKLTITISDRKILESLNECLLQGEPRLTSKDLKKPRVQAILKRAFSDVELVLGSLNEEGDVTGEVQDVLGHNKEDDDARVMYARDAF